MQKLQMQLMHWFIMRDDPSAVARIDEPDGGDAAVPDADVSRAPRQPGAIDDRAVRDHQVKGRHGP